MNEAEICNEALRMMGVDIVSSGSDVTYVMFCQGDMRAKRYASLRPRKHVDCKVIETKRIEGVK